MKTTKETTGSEQQVTVNPETNESGRQIQTNPETKTLDAEIPAREKEFAAASGLFDWFSALIIGCD